jgi:hypothetical protein
MAFPMQEKIGPGFEPSKVGLIADALPFLIIGIKIIAGRESRILRGNRLSFRIE